MLKLTTLPTAKKQKQPQYECTTHMHPLYCIPLGSQVPEQVPTKGFIGPCACSTFANLQKWIIHETTHLAHKIQLGDG